MYSVGSNCFCQFEVKDFWRIAKSLVLDSDEFNVWFFTEV